MILKEADDKPDVIPDEQLMIRIGQGDRTAYKMLVDRHLKPFLGFAMRLSSGDRGEAEDIMQEAFVRVWKYAEKWDMSKNTRFTTWFYRVVMNLSVDAKRKRKPTTDIEHAMHVSSDDPGAEAELSEQQMADQVAEALEKLPERQKQVIILCYLQGMGNKEAAKLMDVTVGAIESLLVRGKAKLAQLLEQQKDELLKEKYNG